MNQLYHFQDKGGRDLALRPELTPTLARMVNAKGPSLKLPLKWFSIPRLFRYEKMQKGRLREFYQLNLDILGASSPWAEVELLSSVVSLMLEVGLGQEDFVIGISSRSMLAALFQQLHIAPEKHPGVYLALDKRLKVNPTEFQENLVKLGLNGGQIQTIESFFKCTELGQIKNLGTSPDFLHSVEELENVFQTLAQMGLGKYIKLDLSVVRGLAYYTGLVFEVFDSQKNLRAIAGGGRYDHLLAHLGGRPLSGVGFGVGDVVIWELLKEKKSHISLGQPLDFYLASFAEPSAEMLAYIFQLRQQGYHVGYSLGPVKLKKQLSEAESLGAKKVLFWGSDKVGPEDLEIKDMSTGEQSVISKLALLAKENHL